MSVVTQPHHLLTLDEWLALPGEESYRPEVQEGILHVVPPPLPFHQRATMRLGGLIDAQLPEGLSALIEVGVVVAESPLTARIPDVVVVDSDLVATNPPHFDGGDIRLAIEVLSDGTRRVDRVMKFAEYAEAGIERYWIVDLDEPVTLTAFGLVKDAYEKTAELTEIATLEFDGRRITLDLDALTTAKAQRP